MTTSAHPRLLGLGGYAFSGKDTTADILVAQYGWRKLYMSQTLEKALLALNPIIDNQPDYSGGSHDVYGRRYQEIHTKLGYDESKKHPEVRGLLQRLGTEVGRNLLGENVWVDAVFGEADLLLAQGLSVAVCGIRYENEMAAVHRRGGRTVWIDRGLKPVNTHTSENAFGPRDFDYQLANTGTLKDLDREVGDMLAWVR